MEKPAATRLNAVALAYQQGAGVPKVIAKGKGLIAEQIIAKANEHGIYIHQSKELVSLLMQLDLDENIPPSLYSIVAQLLAWLYHVDHTSSTFAKPKFPEPSNLQEMP